MSRIISGITVLGRRTLTAVWTPPTWKAYSHHSKMTKSALMIMVQDSEETELVATVDVLRRAGVQVTVAGLCGTDPVKCNQSIVITPDKAFNDVCNDQFDVIILPGGPGADKLAESAEVGRALQSQFKAKRLIAAICGAPIILKSHNIATGCDLTAHNSKKKELASAGYKYLDRPVVVSENVVTSQGPGTAIDFGLKLVELLVGNEKVKELKEHLHVKSPSDAA